MGVPADTLIGTVIDGRFEIRDKLGQGGMGTVYRAWQRSVGREVAIKLIDRSISNDPMSVRRFLREAHLASQLSHPNTISVFDFGHLPDGRLFTAMELLRGKTLGRELRERGAFSLERTVRVGLQLCDALEAAHGQRIVHRDLKLDNVMLLDHGNDLIKVLDFGLAKTLDDKSTHATAAGIVVGTPRYIAPETAMTGEATPASDMYAVGVMLGELTLATPLWEGTTLSIILQSQLQPDPIIAKVPRPMRDVVARLVDPKPQRRPTALETRKLLQSIGEGKPIAAPPEERTTLDMKKSTRDREAAPAKRDARPPSQSRKYSLIAGGTIVFVASVLIAYFATRSPDKRKPPPAVVDNDNKVPATPDAAMTAATPDASVTADPWTTREPTQSPIVKAWTDNQPTAPPVQKLHLRVIGVPKGFLVELNGSRTPTHEFTISRGERVVLEIWNPDHTAIFRSSSFRPKTDEDIDVTIHKLSECARSDRLCRSVYCGAHPDELGCKSHDTDVVNPFD